jgi:hypothetical protein
MDFNKRTGSPQKEAGAGPGAGPMEIVVHGQRPGNTPGDTGSEVGI